jgi:hypothetical protein
MDQFLSGAKKLFSKIELERAQNLIPCSIQEIAELEMKLEIHLPAAYHEFLLWMGKGAGIFLMGFDCFLPDLEKLQPMAAELLNDFGAEFELPDNSFVFLMRQGYQFYFFKSGEGDNPPVYEYLAEDGAKPGKAFESYSQFLSEQILLHAEQKADLLP